LEQLFLVFSKRSHGEEITEFDSDKHSHLPQDLTILTFSRTNGKGNKGLQDKIPIDVFCHFGTDRRHRRRHFANALRRKAASGGRVESQINPRFRILWENFRWGK
jgi:hypothetical protein